MLQVETQPNEMCGTILITRAALLQLHPWLISFSPFKFISNDLYVTKLGQVWKEVSSSVNYFRQWCAENSELCVNRSNCDSFALCISLSLSFSLSVSLSLASSLALLLSLSLSLSLSLFSLVSHSFFPCCSVSMAHTCTHPAHLSY